MEKREIAGIIQIITQDMDHLMLLGQLKNHVTISSMKQQIEWE